MAATLVDVPFNPTKKQYSAYPEFVIDEKKDYTALVHTNKGDITIKLFPKNAPKTVNNFVFLAKSGFYNDIIFHRVIPGFVIQVGDPQGNGMGGPGYRFEDEINPASLDLSEEDIEQNEMIGYEYRKDLESMPMIEGAVAMANAGPGTNGSQIFICLDAFPHLDGRHTVFGTVDKGMDIVKTISEVERNMMDMPVEPVIISSVEITES